MATTGFWPVKGRLKEVIDYARNPDKTTDRKFLDDDLFQALRYVENDSKTDQKLYVSAINCPRQQAYEAMMATKRRFGKLGGNVTHREILKRDVEHCLSLSRSAEDFRKRMESMGYQILRWQEGAHISVIAPGWQRPVRLSSIGYTKETLNARLDQNWEDNTFYIRKSQNPVRKVTPMLYLEMEFRRAQRMDGLLLTFAIFVELLQLCTGSVAEQKNRPLSPMLREEVRKLDQYIEDYQLPCKIVGRTYLISWDVFLRWVTCAD